MITSTMSSSTPPVSPCVVNKIPKTVKALQAGTFTSKQHVSTVLSECEKLLHNDPDMQFELAHFPPAIPSLIQICKRFEDAVEIQEICCGIFRELSSSHDDVRALMAEQGTPQAVLVALLKHETSMKLQTAGLATLANLAMNQKNKTVIPESYGLEVLKTCMKAYPDQAELQVQACRMVAELAEIPSNARTLGALRLSQTIVKLMQEHATHEELQCHASAAIRGLTLENDLNRQQLSSSIPPLLAAIKKFAKNSKLVSLACGALWNLTSQAENVKEVLSLKNNEEGVRTLLAAMKKDFYDGDVQEAGCGVLKNLSETTENASAVGRAGAIVPILTAMRQHEESKAVQAQGCSALCNLAMVNDLKEPILKAGGIRMIITAMKMLQESAEVQKSACRALKNLALDNDQNKISIAASGGINAVLTAMEQHEDNGGVQLLALGALQSFCSLHRNRTTMIRAGGVKIIQAATAKHAKESYIVKVGSEILEQLEAET